MLRVDHRLRSFLLAAALVAFAPAIAAGGSGVSLDLQREATTTPQEKRDYATSAVAEIKKDRDDVQRWLDAAKKAPGNDPDDCLEDVLRKLNALLNVSENAKRDMGGYLDAADGPKAGHEFRKLVVALDMTQQLYASATECNGGSATKAGNLRLDVIGPSFDGDDLADMATDLMDLGYDPPDLSPFF